MSAQGRTALERAKRVVVKIGTNALTNTTGRFHRPHFERLANELLLLAKTRELIIVSSGAIALGVERLGLDAKPRDIPGKQACAAVGQSRLMRAWEEALAPRIVAQVLLTHSDVQDRRRYLNARHALERLISDGVVPVINENDTVSVDEIKFGDNDTLAGPGGRPGERGCAGDLERRGRPLRRRPTQAPRGEAHQHGRGGDAAPWSPPRGAPARAWAPAAWPPSSAPRSR